MSSSPHSIRLREPWKWSDRSPLSTDGPVSGRTVRGRRRFHCPTGLTDEDEVVLIVERFSGAQVALNGQTLPGVTEPDGTWRCEIRARLRSNNEIELEFSAPGKEEVAAIVQAFRRDVIASGGVRLEIHPIASRMGLDATTAR